MSHNPTYVYIYIGHFATVSSISLSETATHQVGQRFHAFDLAVRPPSPWFKFCFPVLCFTGRLLQVKFRAAQQRELMHRLDPDLRKLDAMLEAVRGGHRRHKRTLSAAHASPSVLDPSRILHVLLGLCCRWPVLGTMRCL